MKYIEIPGQPEVRAASTGVQMDPRAAGAVWGAVAQAGTTVGGEVGRYFGLYAENRQAADDAQGLLQWETQIGQAKREIQSALQAEEDESKWPEISDKVFRNLRFEGRNVSQSGRAQAQVIFQRELENERASVHTQFLKADAVRKVATYDAGVEMAVEDGDIDRARKLINEGGSIGIYSPKVVQEKTSEAEEKMDYYDVTSLIENNPEEAVKLLSEQTEGGRFVNFKNLSPYSRSSLRGRASQRGIDEQREFYTEVIKQAERGEFAEPEQVIAWMDEGKLSPWHAKAYRQGYLGKTPQSLNVEAYAGRMRAIDEYDAREDPSREEFARLMGSIIGIPSEQAGFLRNRLEAKLNPQSVSNREGVREGYAIIDQYFDNGYLGNTSKSQLDGRPRDRDAYQKAVTKQLRLKDELDRFFKNNDTASRVEIQKFINSLLQVDRDVAVISIRGNSNRSVTNDVDAEETEAVLEASGYYRR